MKWFSTLENQKKKKKSRKKRNGTNKLNEENLHELRLCISINLRH